MHYLDDYLTLVPSAPACKENLKLTFARLGVPLAEEKLEGPSTTILFLGIILDSVHLEAHLPADKLEGIKIALAEWSSKRTATKRELSLIGHLSFAAKVVPPARTFLRRMIDLSSSQPTLDSTITLNHPIPNSQPLLVLSSGSPLSCSTLNLAIKQL